MSAPTSFHDNVPPGYVFGQPAPRPITAEMRDQQALGRGHEDTGGFEMGYSTVAGRPWRAGDALPGESAHEAEQRGHALSVLTNNNTLLTYAISRNDTLPSQRYTFLAMLCGFNEPERGRKRRVQEPGTENEDPMDSK